MERVIILPGEGLHFTGQAVKVGSGVKICVWMRVVVTVVGDDDGGGSGGD